MRYELARLTKRYPNLYRWDILEQRREQLGLSQREVARRANINQETAKTIFAGTARAVKVYPIAKVLGVDWAALHNLKLQKSKFHLAFNGGRKAG